MEKIKTGLFGSAFNPIGMHHEHIAFLINRHTGMNIWMMPCFSHVFSDPEAPKNVAKDVLESSPHRYNMVEGVTKQHPSVMTACDWEIAHQHNGVMIETIEALHEMHPDREFIPIIGMDNANCIRADWTRGEELIERYTFIVVTRKLSCPYCASDIALIGCGYCENEGSVWQDPIDDWFQKAPHMELKFDYPVSSSMIREAVGQRKNSQAMKYCNPLTWDYIIAEKLYGYQTDNDQKST